MKHLKYLFYTIAMICITILLIYLGNQLSKDQYSDTLVSKTGFYLDTYITIQIYDSAENYNETIQNTDDIYDLIERSLSLCGKYELIFSKTNTNSELYKLNENPDPTVRISKELYEVLEKSLYYSSISNGKFDVTISNLSDLWNFKNATVPSDSDILSNLSSVNYESISLSEINGHYYVTKNNSKMDLGGIAKGYIADKLRFYLAKNGIRSAIINLGGNTIVMGDKPDSSQYVIGIQEPFADSGEYRCSINVTDKSIVTSGIYERMFKVDENIYHHIIDPDTGYPSTSNVYSATIISDDSIDGDALSTVCVLLGYSKAIELINSLEDVECILITNNNEIVLSNGLEQIGTSIYFR